LWRDGRRGVRRTWTRGNASLRFGLERRVEDPGPGVDEFDDPVGVFVVVAEIGDGVEERGVDEDVGVLHGAGLDWFFSCTMKARRA
jgi:hypothetical protein